jgi:ADP-ribose pyrophosphatase YjhB (NUDIX family)
MAGNRDKTTDGEGTPDFSRLDFPRPLTTVDVVIFTVREGVLQVLLVQRPADENEPFPSAWALPGGFVDTIRDVDLQSCAVRKLKDKTGMVSPYLEQLGSWGSATRDPRGWSATHAYFALLPAAPVAGAGAADARWFPVDAGKGKPKLAFDHADGPAAGLRDRARPPAGKERVPHPHAGGRSDRAGGEDAQRSQPACAAVSAEEGQIAGLFCPDLQPAGLIRGLRSHARQVDSVMPPVQGSPSQNSVSA